MKILIFSIFLGLSGSSIAQDSIRIKNRFDSKPDTSSDTSNVKGGALIDTIFTEPDDTLSSNKVYSQSGPFAFQDDGRSQKLAEVEKELSALKERLKEGKNPELRSSIASLENKKNNLKARLKNEALKNDTKEVDSWNADYAQLKAKIESVKNPK